MANTPDRIVRYVPSVAKALEVILWLAERKRGIDLIHLVKSAFYADKHHVAHYGRPITGDIYRAAWFGPLPQVIYGLLRHEPMEMLALGTNGPLPFKIDDAYRVCAERGPNLSKLSASDIEALEVGIKEVTEPLLTSSSQRPITIRPTAMRSPGRSIIAISFRRIDPNRIARPAIPSTCSASSFSAPRHVIEIWDRHCASGQRHICVCDERQLFLRINSDRYIGLRILAHNSFLHHEEHVELQQLLRQLHDIARARIRSLSKRGAQAGCCG